MSEPPESPLPRPLDPPTEAEPTRPAQNLKDSPGPMVKTGQEADKSKPDGEGDPKSGKMQRLKQSKRSWSARVRAFVLSAEAFHDLAILLLRFFELALFGGVLLALTVGLVRWVWTGPTLPEVMKVLATDWQGAVIIGLILVMPTIRELVERVQKLPGGWQIRTREERHVQHRQVEDEDGSESEEET